MGRLKVILIPGSGGTGEAFWQQEQAFPGVAFGVSPPGHPDGALLETIGERAAVDPTMSTFQARAGDPKTSSSAATRLAPVSRSSMASFTLRRRALSPSAAALACGLRFLD